MVGFSKPRLVARVMHGGQFVLVVLELRLIMVLVSLSDTDPDVVHGGELPQFVDLTRPLWKTN